ncbi:MAG TPA: cadmium resistance transporter [Edaphobacter sp.]|nr:cadmium resistance transporter [Edaphobacter sp.]
MAIALFASTNVDDMFVLVGFFADPKFRPRDIVTGQYVGITALFALALLGSLLALVISRAYIGLLGVVAIGVGAKRLFDLYRNRELTESSLEHHDTGRHTRVATVALLTLANGADNLGIYMPAFAIRSPIEIGMIAIIFAVMTGLWCFFAHWIVHHPTFGKPIRRYGQRVAPLVLIAIGISILYDAGSFGLLVRGSN